MHLPGRGQVGEVGVLILTLKAELLVCSPVNAPDVAEDADVKQRVGAALLLWRKQEEGAFGAAFKPDEGADDHDRRQLRSGVGDHLGCRPLAPGAPENAGPQAIITGAGPVGVGPARERGGAQVRRRLDDLLLGRLLRWWGRSVWRGTSRRLSEKGQPRAGDGPAVVQVRVGRKEAGVSSGCPLELGGSRGGGRQCAAKPRRVRDGRLPDGAKGPEVRRCQGEACSEGL